MTTTVPSYTIFTCDCCGREQDDRPYQEHVASGSTRESSFGPIRSYPVSWKRRDKNFYSYWVNENSLEVCEECAQRIHEAIEGVKNMAMAERVALDLAAGKEEA